MCSLSCSKPSCAIPSISAHSVTDKTSKKRSGICLISQLGDVSENGIYGHSRFCNTDFDDKLACLNLSGV
ncbi:hypothetical protein F8C00_06680 [Escherichia coli]|nr:hypothetical protein [Escherichia coli]